METCELNVIYKTIENDTHIEREYLTSNLTKETRTLYVGAIIETTWVTIEVLPTATDDEITQAIAQTQNNLTPPSYRWLFDTSKEVSLDINVCPNALCELGMALEKEGYTVITERMADDFFIVEINPDVEVEAHFDKNIYILKSAIGSAKFTTVESVVKAVNALNVAVFQFSNQ